jgi:hypothetical protein
MILVVRLVSSPKSAVSIISSLQGIIITHDYCPWSTIMSVAPKHYYFAVKQFMKKSDNWYAISLDSGDQTSRKFRPPRMKIDLN